MRTFWLALCLLAASGCCVLTPMAPPATVSGRIEVSRESLAVTGREFHVWVKFAAPVDAPWLIQEIRSDAGYTVVEAFRLHGGVMCGPADHHWGSTRERRDMLLYTGEIEGYDASHSFAMLESNLDGSLRTTTGPEFNREFRARHGIAGRVKRADANAVTWALVFDGVSVTLQGVN